MTVLPFQIYRHFKGGLYLVLSIAVSTDSGVTEVVYLSLNGDNKVWTRELTEFTSLVPEDRENPTGQKNRFELVKDITSVLSQCSTENLVEELKKRPDNPFNDLDLEGLNSKVVLRDYIAGEFKDYGILGKTVDSLVAYDTVDQVKTFLERNPHRCNDRTKIYRRVFIEEDFD